MEIDVTEQLCVVASKDPRRIGLNGRILVAHQAEFLPWLGFLSKACMGDCYLILDNTQFKIKDYQNRNRIRFPNDLGWIWLNVPVRKTGKVQNMLDVRIVDQGFRVKHLKTIVNSYRRSAHFEEIYPEIEKAYSYDTDKLVEFNINLIKYAFQVSDLNIPVFRVSELVNDGYLIRGYKNDLVLSMCKVAGADFLVLGSGGRSYIKTDLFKQNNIKVIFQRFVHPSYRQYHGGFIPNMSFIDALFCLGKKEFREIIQPSGYEEEL